ncbi:MAG: branched-chain amino acid aminotransferase, branched-chain amino acid aminotransferase [Candidatus Dadabacteria bacterium CSP1-2]|nr:MAG: branched-chain amino acid aminotransferase, branched-chain amino acid aminotransferase [Candidatus Dadabacteria bacterium CSP1-2]
MLTHTLHYGLGVFEGVRAYECHDGRAAAFRLTDHINRLYSSARIAQINIPFSKEEMRKAIFDLLIVNRFKEAYIRPIAFIGDGAMGVHPRNNPIRVAIAAYPWGAYLGDEAVTKGIRAKIASYTRMHVNTFMTKAKISGNYVNSVMAKLEVTSLGFDEAIMLDTEGYVSEGSGENIFIVRNGTLKTPSLTSILEGITRNSTMEIALDEGLQVVTERFTRDELYIADEAFLTGTAAEITPIREVDGRTIGDGVPGPVTRRLQERFFDVVRGKDEKFINWLDFVP